MKTIYKYTIAEMRLMQIDMPEGAKFLCCKLQRGDPQMWFEVDPNAKLVKRTFSIVGTGHNIEPNQEYLGTYLSEGQTFVWHLYGAVK